MAPHTGHVSNFYCLNQARSNRHKGFITQPYPRKHGSSIQAGYPVWTRFELVLLNWHRRSVLRTPTLSALYWVLTALNNSCIFRQTSN
jgi:hypothetical protein